MNTITWKQIGKLAKVPSLPHKPQITGVYLHIFRNDTPRLIYVGTSIDIYHRLQEHISNMTIGANTIFKAPSKDTDIYSFMSIKTTLNEYVHYLKQNTAKIWIPTNKTGKHHLDPQYKWDHGWQSYVTGVYLEYSDIWYCELEKSLITTLEAKIQSHYREKYKIGYYFKDWRYSWLGKQEINDSELGNISFISKNTIPGIDFPKEL